MKKKITLLILVVIVGLSGLSVIVNYQQNKPKEVAQSEKKEKIADDLINDQDSEETEKVEEKEVSTNNSNISSESEVKNSNTNTNTTNSDNNTNSENSKNNTNNTTNNSTNSSNNTTNNSTKEATISQVPVWSWLINDFSIEHYKTKAAAFDACDKKGEQKIIVKEMVDGVEQESIKYSYYCTDVTNVDGILIGYMLRLKELNTGNDYNWR